MNPANMMPDQLSTFGLRPYLPWLIWGLGLCQAVHSLEEVATGLWRWLPVVTTGLNARFDFVPALEWSGEGFALANMVIISLMLAFSPFVFLNHTWAWKAATVLAVLETVNGTGHLTGALVTGGYFPGCISAVGLIVLGAMIWGRGFAWKEKE